MKKWRKIISCLLALLIFCSLFVTAAGSAAALQPYCKGDVTGDGQVTTKDVLAIQKVIANMLAFTPQQKQAAEVTGDEKIGVSDVLKIQKYIAKMIDTLDPDIVTRAQWIDMLVQTVGIAPAAEESDPYFSDLENGEYYTSVQSAAAFGVLPDTGQFYPALATDREYAAYTAVHALGFYDNGYTLSCADAAAVSYKPEAYIALKLSLLSLQNERFEPKAAVTRSQAQAILSEITAIKQGETVAEDYDSKVTYQKDVTVLSADTLLFVNENHVVLTGNVPQLQAGDVFVEPENQLACKVVDVQMKNGQTIVQTEQPAFEEVADSFDLQNSACGDISKAQPLTEGIEITYEQAAVKRVQSNGTEEKSGVQIPQNLVLSLPEIELADGVELTAKIKIPPPQVDFKFKGEILGNSLYIEDMYAAITKEMNAEIEVKASTEHIKALGKSIKLLRVPVPLGYGFFVNVDIGLKVTLEGKVTLTSTLAETAGVRILHNMPAAVYDLNASMEAEINASVKAGLEAGLVFSFLKFDFVDFTLFSGPAAELAVLGKLSEHAESCGDAAVYIFADMTIGENSFLGQLAGITYEIELMNKDTSFLRMATHWEDGVFIPACTKDQEKPTDPLPTEPTLPDMPDLGMATPLSKEGYTAFSADGTDVPKSASLSVNSSCTATNIIIPEQVELPKYVDGKEDGTVLVPVAEVHVYSPYVLAVTLPKTLDTQKRMHVLLPENVVSVTYAPGTVKIGSVERTYGGMSGVREINIPQTVTEIDDSAFFGVPVERLLIPQSVKKIGDHAFSDCTNLQTLQLPEDVQIGEFAFYNTTALKTLVLPQNTQLKTRAFYATGIRSLTIQRGISYNYEDDAWGGFFEGAKNLKEVVLQEGVTALGAHMFLECRALEKITLPDTISTAQEAVFWYCEKLTEVTLPKNLKKIPDNMFKQSGLQKLMIPAGIEDISDTAFNDTDLSYVVFAEGLTVLRSTARCEAIRWKPSEIVLPSTLQKIEGGTYPTVSATKVTIKSVSAQLTPGSIQADKICAPKGSTAQQYAKANGIEFIQL